MKTGALANPIVRAAIEALQIAVVESTGAAIRFGQVVKRGRSLAVFGAIEKCCMADHSQMVVAQHAAALG